MVARLAVQMEQVEEMSQWLLYQAQVAIRKVNRERDPKDSGRWGCPAAFPHHV